MNIPGELILAVVASVLGFFIGGIYGEINYGGWSPHCWYGLLTGLGIVFGLPLVAHVCD